jgi:hypothetical protein
MSRRDKTAWRPVCQGTLLYVGRTQTESGTPGGGGESSEESGCVEELSRVMSTIIGASPGSPPHQLTSPLQFLQENGIPHSTCYKPPKISCLHNSKKFSVQVHSKPYAVRGSGI